MFGILPLTISTALPYPTAYGATTGGEVLHAFFTGTWQRTCVALTDPREDIVAKNNGALQAFTVAMQDNRLKVGHRCESCGK